MTRLLRYYTYCAKGGHRWMHDHAAGRFVCNEHAGPGGYTHCAVCGEAFPDDPAWARCWVHEECMAKGVAA